MILLLLRCKLLFKPHHVFFTSVLLLVLFCQIFMPLVKFCRYICKLKCEPEYVSIKSNVAVTLFPPYHNNAIATCELIALSSGGEQKHLAGCKSPSILLSAVNKHVERTF